jgi:ribosomal protein S6
MARSQNKAKAIRVKKYEGLFILNTAGKEEGVKEAIDKITAEISALGGKVETTQKMDKKNFTRVADKKHTAGFYVNVIFETDEKTIPALRNRIALSEDIFRVMFTVAPTGKPVATIPAQ